MSSKFQLEFDGMNKLIKKLEAQEKNLKRATESALKATYGVVTPQVKAAMNPHNLTGQTQDAIVKSADVKWEGDIASVGVGFSISNGGLASIFLMYGTQQTPRHTGTDADMALYNAIYGSATNKKVRDAQQEAFFKVLERTK